MERNSYAIGLAIGDHAQRLTKLEQQMAGVSKEVSDLKTWGQRLLLLALVWAWPLLVPIVGDDLAQAAAKALKAALRIG